MINPKTLRQEQKEAEEKLKKKAEEFAKKRKIVKQKAREMVNEFLKEKGLTTEEIEKNKNLTRTAARIESLKLQGKKAEAKELEKNLDHFIFKRKKAKESEKTNKEVVNYIKLMENGGLRIINKQTGKIREEAKPFIKAAKKMMENDERIKNADEQIKDQMMDVHDVLGKRTQEEMIKLRKLQKKNQ